MQLDDDSAHARTTALAAVLTYSIDRAFGLSGTEIDTVTAELETLIAPLRGRESPQPPPAVAHEIASGKRLAALDDAVAAQRPAKPAGTVAARMDEWVDVLHGVIARTYTLSPADDLVVTGGLARLLQRLGVGSSRRGHCPPSRLASLLA